MFYVYVLKSLRDQKLYIGSTANLKRRFKEHNLKRCRSTKARAPFELIYYESFMNKTDSRKRELELKSNGQQRESLKARIINSL